MMTKQDHDDAVAILAAWYPDSVGALIGTSLKNAPASALTMLAVVRERCGWNAALEKAAQWHDAQANDALDKKWHHHAHLVAGDGINTPGYEQDALKSYEFFSSLATTHDYSARSLRALKTTMPAQGKEAEDAGK